MDEADLYLEMTLLAEELAVARAYSRLNSYLLAEIIKQVVTMKDDPDRFLADVMERIETRAEQVVFSNESFTNKLELNKAMIGFFEMLHALVDPSMAKPPEV